MSVCHVDNQASPRLLSFGEKYLSFLNLTQIHNNRNTKISKNSDLELKRAIELINSHKYADGISILRQLVHRMGRNSDMGMDTSYLLICTLREDGQYNEAMSEYEALKAAINNPATLALSPEARLIHSDLPKLYISLYCAESVEKDAIEKVNKIAQLHKPLDLKLAQADLAMVRDKNDDAANLIIQAIDIAIKSRHITTRQYHQIRFYSHILYSNPVWSSQTRKYIAFVKNENNSVLLRTLIFYYLSRIESKDKVYKIALTLSRNSISNNALTNVAHDIIDKYQSQVIAVRESAALKKMVEKAVNAEAEGKWNVAIKHNQQIFDYCRSSSYNIPILDLYKEQANRSIPILSSAGTSNTNSSYKFLGIDHTIGSHWIDKIGADAWVLFGIHGTDLCGGKSLLSHDFSYRSYIGDHTNQVRHWRDPYGYNTRKDSDLPLDDSAMPGNKAISFLDDNGEQYPYGAGPDLYLDLKIPAGDFVLSFPLHFSDPGNKKTRYRLYLLKKDTDWEDAAVPLMNNNDKTFCLSSELISASDGSGYERLTINGPALYTLVIRRLDSFNANLPAIFLDRIDHGQRNLRDDFTSEEISASGLQSYGSATKGVIAAPKYSSSQFNLNKLVNDFRIASEDTDFVNDDKRWVEIADHAESYINDSSLNNLQKAVAAWISWQASEHILLKSADRLRAFERYLNCRFIGKKEKFSLSNADININKLHNMARKYRSESSIGYAESCDNIAWSLDMERYYRSFGSSLSKDNDTFRQIWKNGPANYLEYQEAWEWFGEGHKPQRLHIALDAQYASRKASESVNLLINNPNMDFDDTRAVVVRNWIDNIATDMDISINSTNSVISKDSELYQPLGSIIYFAACEPIIGKTNNTPNKTLLRVDQIELAARALIGRSMFPVDEYQFDLKNARSILVSLENNHTDYPRRDHISELIKSIPE